ncbi:unnamed protein product, partial [Phaeothamnion confervicola]
AHAASHEPCRVPGCGFAASRKVVSAHYHARHGKFAGSGFKMIDVEGQKFQVLLGTSPDEVAQWREERRRRWPTPENVQRRAEERASRREAGALEPWPEGSGGAGRRGGRGGGRGARAARGGRGSDGRGHGGWSATTTAAGDGGGIGVKWAAAAAASG